MRLKKTGTTNKTDRKILTPGVVHEAQKKTA